MMRALCFPVGVKKGFLLALILLSLVQTSKSQFFETGQDPFSVSWKQIKTKNYKLIFPEGFEQNAQRFASVMDTFYTVSSKFLLKNPKPVSIVFHTQSSLSNGLVVYAPKRMELYTIPPQDNYPQDWIDQLALHETRHVAQLDALNQGLTKLGSVFIGQQAVGAVTGLVPRWFLEGDAVYSETLFSSSGRGRSAAFLMPYRTLTLTRDKLFSYEKALLGSYKHFVPDVYQMGYPMVKMMRDSFDQDIFGKGLRYTGRNPYLVFPFGHKLDQISGLNNRNTYKYTYSTLKKSWELNNQYSSYSRLPVKEEKTFTNYNLPIVLNNSGILVQKWSLSDTRHFSLIDKNGKEKKLVSIGSNNSDRLSVNGNKFTWSENKSDIRWQNRTYSEVMVYDIDRKKLRRMTKKTWYFSPAFSPDGKFLAVVEETPQYKSSLVILDATTGKEIKKIDAPLESHLQHPLWSKVNEIYCLSVTRSGKSIIKLNSSESWETVLPNSLKNVSSFCFADEKLVIAGENNGVNNIFIYDTSTKTYSQVTNSQFGAFEPSFDINNQLLYFSEYSPNGYRFAFVPWNPKSYPESISYYKNKILPDTIASAQFNVQTIAKDSPKHVVKNYSRLPNLLNIHSWLPAYFNYNISDITNPNIYPGFLLLSQDVLGTFVSSYGYSYQKGYSHLHANLSYKALLPVINWNVNFGGPVSRVGGSSKIPTYYSTNLKSTVNISLPLNLSRGVRASGLIPYAEWEYDREAYFIRSENRYYQGLSSINWGINYYWYTRMATRDLYPRFGFSSFFKMQTTPFEDKLFNTDISAFSFRQYLPGLFNSHSFQVRYAYQWQSRYLYSSMIAFPAGYHSSRTEQLHALNVNYALPIFYPDLHAGPVFYLKRIRANVFHDLVSNRYHPLNKPNIISHDILRSVGTDIVADIHFLRIMFPFQVGLRVGYLPNERQFFTESIFSVNLVY